MNKEYREFINGVMKRFAVEFALPEERVWFESEEKNNRLAEDEIFVRIDGDEPPTRIVGIHAADLYRYFRQGTPIEKLVSDTAYEIRRTVNAVPLEHIGTLKDYAEVKDRLFLRAISHAKYEKYRECGAAKCVGDIVLAVYLLVSEEEGNVISGVIPANAIEKWNVSREQILDDAAVNTAMRFPPRLYDSIDALLHGDPRIGNLMNPFEQFTISRESESYCVTNPLRINGAAAVFLPGVAQRIADLIGDDYYLAFTSIHEVFLHRASVTALDNVRCALAESNCRTNPEDVLTGQVYMYSRKKDEIGCVTQTFSEYLQ